MRLNWRDVALSVLTTWWWLTRPQTVGVRGLVANDAGEILFVRHSYAGRKWFLPGGGHHGNESPAAALVREMREETGLDVQVARLIGVYFYTGSYKRDHIYIFECNITGGQTRLVGGEISEIGWFAPDTLPQPLMLGLDKIFDDWRSGVAGFGAISR